MLTKTTLLAIRSLEHLALDASGQVVSPRRLAEALGESPTYMAKVAQQLARAGILRAEKGVKGGVRLSRPPEAITLLQVVEACQGAIVGDFCESGRSAGVCSFHQAALELHHAIVGVLGRWTLAHLLVAPSSRGAAGLSCLMAGRMPALIPLANLPRD